MSLDPPFSSSSVTTYTFPKSEQTAGPLRLRSSASEFRQLKNARSGIRRTSPSLRNTLRFDFHSRLFCVGMLERKPQHWEIQAVSRGHRGDSYHRKQTETIALGYSLPQGLRTEHILAGTWMETSLDCLKSSFKRSPALCCILRGLDHSKCANWAFHANSDLRLP